MEAVTTGNFGKVETGQNYLKLVTQRIISHSKCVILFDSLLFDTNTPLMSFLLNQIPFIVNYPK
jgi:hypothetical protein